MRSLAEGVVMVNRSSSERLLPDAPSVPLLLSSPGPGQDQKQSFAMPRLKEKPGVLTPTSFRRLVFDSSWT
jgi:hypothetical protein